MHLHSAELLQALAAYSGKRQWMHRLPTNCSPGSTSPGSRCYAHGALSGLCRRSPPDAWLVAFLGLCDALSGPAASALVILADDGRRHIQHHRVQSPHHPHGHLFLPFTTMWKVGRSRANTRTSRPSSSALRQSRRSLQPHG